MIFEFVAVAVGGVCAGALMTVALASKWDAFADAAADNVDGVTWRKAYDEGQRHGFDAGMAEGIRLEQEALSERMRPGGAWPSRLVRDSGFLG